MAQSSQSAQAEKSIAQNKAKKRHTGTVFNTRFAAHKDELERLFMSLYNNHAAFESLIDSMAEAYADRPADLKRLDKSREQDPDWYKRGDMFGMTMYTDLFAGDLKKLADKIPYLKEQKLTYLHLMPLLDMPHPNNDGGYVVQDFDTVDPKLGTNEDLAVLAKKLRRAGISLCIDSVSYRFSFSPVRVVQAVGAMSRVSPFINLDVNPPRSGMRNTVTAPAATSVDAVVWCMMPPCTTREVAATISGRAVVQYSETVSLSCGSSGLTRWSSVVATKNSTARTSSMMMKVMSSAGLATTAFTSMDAPETTKNTGIRKP